MSKCPNYNSVEPALRNNVNSIEHVYMQLSNESAQRETHNAMVRKCYVVVVL